MDTKIKNLLPLVKANKHTYYNLDNSAKKDFRDLYGYLKKNSGAKVEGFKLKPFKSRLNSNDLEYLNKFKAMEILISCV